MDKKKATDFIQKLLVSNEDKKPEEQFTNHKKFYNKEFKYQDKENEN